MKRLIFPILFITLAMPLLFQVKPLEILKLRTFDNFLPIQEPTGNFAILEIRESDIEANGGWPFPRGLLASIQYLLYEAGSIGQAWAFTFPQPDRMGEDQDFAQALSYGPSVLAMFESPNGSYPPTEGVVVMGEDVGGFDARGVVENIDILKQNAAQGVANAPTSADGLTRQIPLLLRTPDGYAISFALQIMKQLTQQDTIIINTTNNEIALPSIPPISVDHLHRRWVSYVDTPKIYLDDLKQAEGKYIIIGTSGGGIMPQIATPQGLKNPAEVQAALLESILLPNSPKIPEWHLAAELALYAVLALLAWFLTQKLTMFIGLGSLTITMAGVAYFGFYTIQQGMLLDVTWSLISQFIIASASYYNKYRTNYLLRQQIKEQFGRYLDKRYIKQLQDDPSLCQINGSLVNASMIFTDLRGFTKLSSEISPEAVCKIMNEVLDAQVKAANELGLVTDKFIGDAAFFHANTIIPQENHHDLVLECAQRIVKNIEALNEQYIEEGRPTVAIGVGVNSGLVVGGNQGATNRFAWSLVGDACNVAARLESATKEVGVDVLIGHETATHSSYDLIELDPIYVKGKDEKLRIYTFAEV